MSPTDVPTGDNTYDFDLSPPSPEQRRALESALTREERDVLLNHGTEQPFCGTLLNNKKSGVYCCKLCGLHCSRRTRNSKVAPAGRASRRRSPKSTSQW